MTWKKICGQFSFWIPLALAKICFSRLVAQIFFELGGIWAWHNPSAEVTLSLVVVVLLELPYLIQALSVEPA